MKFVPKNVTSNRKPFCSLGGGNHGVFAGATCDECGAVGLTNTTSDHMGIELHPDVRGPLATLCLPCAEMYKEMWALSWMVGA